MLFLVFVAFYLHADHAPWWVWVLAGLGALVDEWRDSRS